MSYDLKNLEYAHEQINAMRERARLKAMIREAQPAKVAMPFRARATLILQRLFPKSAKRFGETRASADSTKGLLLLPNLIVSDPELRTSQHPSHTLL